ncbi:hypothetical protein HanHA300_Chr04g0143641 [Helianthus annuus]|nr:hypothetical protein HanHA300_Chr04g0143641 [Helianthus annuus]KAJ0758275.1 hypothetical protein HanLR1_Chr04g0148531 [Helianthus annuus]
MKNIFAENGLTGDDTGASFSAAMGMNVLAGSAVMSLTLIWPSVIAFGSYDLAEDDDDDTILPQITGEEPSFIKKLTGIYIGFLHRIQATKNHKHFKY